MATHHIVVTRDVGVHSALYKNLNYEKCNTQGLLQRRHEFSVVAVFIIRPTHPFVRLTFSNVDMAFLWLSSLTDNMASQFLNARCHVRRTKADHEVGPRGQNFKALDCPTSQSSMYCFAFLYTQ
jgi:hypothetical protein